MAKRPENYVPKVKSLGKQVTEFVDGKVYEASGQIRLGLLNSFGLSYQNVPEKLLLELRMQEQLLAAKIIEVAKNALSTKEKISL